MLRPYRFCSFGDVYDSMNMIRHDGECIYIGS